MNDSIIQGIKERVSTAIKANATIGIQVPEARHADLIQSIINLMNVNTNDHWTFVTVNNTHTTLETQYPELKDLQNLHLIDCISTYAGIIEPDTATCTYIDSPTMLETITLEAIHSYRQTSPEQEKFLLIDSLSAFALHNNSALMKKFMALLVNRARSDNVHIVTIVIEEENTTNSLLQLNEKIIVLRDSFIG